MSQPGNGWEFVGEVSGPDGWEFVADIPQQRDNPSGASQPNAFVQAITNIPGSAINYGRSLIEPFIHPRETIAGLQHLVSGAAQKIPGVSEGLDYVRERVPESMAANVGTRADIPVADAVGGFYANRYGSFEALKKTSVEDPVGLAADVSALAGLTAQALRLGGLSKAANVAGKVSQFTDPLGMAVKGTGAATKFAVSKTTGAGAVPIEEAYKGGQAFKDAMRGKTSAEDVVSASRDALDDIRHARGAAYRTELAKLGKATRKIPINDLKTRADEWLVKYNVTKKNGELDFSRATVSGQSANEVKEVYSMLQDWGSKPGDRTPVMLDVLKRRLDDVYSTSNNSRAMVTDLRKAVHQKISAAVPEYKKMTGDYAKSTAVINELKRAMSLGDRASADTALRKLMTAIREDSTYRRDLIRTLEKGSGKDIMGAAGGLMMNPAYSNRLGSLLSGLGIGVGIMADPTVIALVPLASPRVVGELTVLAGQVGRGIQPFKTAAPVAYQVGRLPLESGER